METTSHTETVFAWLWGQDDNIGDSALRRGYVHALHQRGPIVAYCADASADYISGLGLDDNDKTEPSLGRWLRAILASARKGPVTVAINAGEFSFSGSYILQSIRILPVLSAVHRLGGKIVWLGAAVPRTRRGVTWMFRSLYRLSDLVRWRDLETSTVFERADFMPDWALSLPAEGHTKSRGALGVSLRFDRPYPSESWLNSVRELATRLELDIVSVAQVKRDSDYATRLAADLNGRAVQFRSGSHREKETALRGEYANMKLMLSDRLHGLLIALTEGAVPLAWTPAATSKMTRHFDALGLTWATTSADQQQLQLSALTNEQLDGYAVEASNCLEQARAEVAEASMALANLR